MVAQQVKNLTNNRGNKMYILIVNRAERLEFAYESKCQDMAQLLYTQHGANLQKVIVHKDMIYILNHEQVVKELQVNQENDSNDDIACF